jgi:DNA-binding NarL/FixJ family response regulator
VDAVLLNLCMPAMDGIATIKELKVNYPDLAVVMLTLYTHELQALACVKEGLAGYVSKEASAGEISAAVAEGMAGRKGILHTDIPEAVSNESAQSARRTDEVGQPILEMPTAGAVFRQIAKQTSIPLVKPEKTANHWYSAGVKSVAEPAAAVRFRNW